MIFYDTREAHSVLFFQAHVQGVRAMAFNPVERFLFATACEDGGVSLWDQRATAKPLHSMAGHAGAVTGLAWSPFNACILASNGMDRRVNLWDISRVGIGKEGEAKIGAAKQSDRGFDEPEELLFVHGGHRAAVRGVSWNPNVRPSCRVDGVGRMDNCISGGGQFAAGVAPIAFHPGRDGNAGNCDMSIVVFVSPVIYRSFGGSLRFPMILGAGLNVVLFL